MENATSAGVRPVLRATFVGNRSVGAAVSLRFSRTVVFLLNGSHPVTETAVSIRNRPIAPLCTRYIGPIDASNAHTAILLFSHRPDREWKNKQFVERDMAKSRAVATALYQHTQTAIAGSEYPVLVFDDDRQRGSTFGERLANAFTDAFADGYDHVIAVGSDCPRIGDVDWEAVDGHVQAGRSVLGPTDEQRGAYLIALSEEQFDPDSFAHLPWQTPQLFEAITAYLTTPSGAAPVRLPPRADVNRRRDLLVFLDAAERPLTSLADRLRVLLGRAVFGIPSLSRPTSAPVCVARGRGPPVVRPSRTLDVRPWLCFC